MLKEEASPMIRLEIAKGKINSEALYLRAGHSFCARSADIMEKRDNSVS